MNATTPRNRLSWSARLLIGLTLIIIGAAAAIWALARYERAAQFLGVTKVDRPEHRPGPVAATASFPQQPLQPRSAVPEAVKISELEARLSRVENATRQAAGSVGRADALVIAFAARRALDRGVSLGYLEPLLVDRFGAQYPQAVAMVVTSARAPVKLDQLVAEYEALGPQLRGGGPNEGWLEGARRELASLVEIRHADRPSARPDARYRNALARLSSGQVDAALAETMRLPGASRATAWAGRARRYVAAHRALDQLESAALLGPAARG